MTGSARAATAGEIARQANATLALLGITLAFTVGLLTFLGRRLYLYMTCALCEATMCRHTPAQG